MRRTNQGRKQRSPAAWATPHCRFLKPELIDEFQQWMRELELRRSNAGSNAPAAFLPDKPIPLEVRPNEPYVHRLQQFAKHALKEGNTNRTETITHSYLKSNP